jgi:uncharacterized protein with PQ loop repeat
MNKGVFEMGRDFLADFIGLERGVFYTAKKLLLNPHEVVESYKAKDSRICTPFSFIVLVFSFFFFVTYQVGLESFIFRKAEQLSAVTGIPAIGAYFPFAWANLPFLFSMYIVLHCGFLSALTKKLNLSFYDHVVANLNNSAIAMVPITMLFFVLPITDFNPNIFFVLMVGFSLSMIFLKKFKLRILYYYPEEVRHSLKRPMFITGILMGLSLSPFFIFIFNGHL